MSKIKFDKKYTENPMNLVLLLGKEIKTLANDEIELIEYKSNYDILAVARSYAEYHSIENYKKYGWICGLPISHNIDRISRRVRREFSDEEMDNLIAFCKSHEWDENFDVSCLEPVFGDMRSLLKIEAPLNGIKDLEKRAIMLKKFFEE